MRVFSFKYEDQYLEELIPENILFKQICQFMDIEYLRWSGKRRWYSFLDEAIIDALEPFSLSYVLKTTLEGDTICHGIYVFTPDLPESLLYKALCFCR